MADFTTKRITMVDTQIRPADVTKFPVLQAMLTVPRELFVPDELRDAAYLGDMLPLGQGRVLLEPRNLAKALDALNIQPDELVLDVGAGLGYSVAVIAQLAEAVVGLEEDSHMASEAERILGEVGADNGAMIHGPLAIGARKHGPYDVIMIAGGVETIPEKFLDQLKDGGRIAAFFIEGELGVCRIGQKTGNHVSWRDAFNGFVPILPGFAAEREFAL